MKSNGIRKNFNINPVVLGILFFISATVFFVLYRNKNLISKSTYYIDTLNSELPILFQERNGEKLNELRGYVSEEYSLTSNETITMLEEGRRITLLVNNNKNQIGAIEYEIRDKTSNKLLERTKLDKEYITTKKNITRISFVLQNLIKSGTTYLLTIKMNVGIKTIYYFTNVMYKPKNNKLDEAIAQVKDFTLKTFDEKKAVELVKFLETSVNRDSKEMYNVTLQQTFEQLTFANTGMSLESDIYYSIYQAQDYSYNIVANYLTKSSEKSKNEYFINKDQYVLRWDGIRWYYMKFTRETEELLNMNDNPYDANGRLYLGITDPNKFDKIESKNGKYFAFCKQKEVYIYDVDDTTLTNIFSYRIKDNESFANVAKNFNVKIMDVADNGDVTYIVYGYNMTGLNEGYMGINIFVHNVETNESEEKIFIPIYTSYQSLRYDIDELCVLKNNRLIFKSYNKVYSIDIDTSDILTLAEDFEETKFAASDNSKYFAFNNDKEGKSKHINIYNIEESKITTIDAKEDENIEVVTFMNDDLFYGVFSDEDLWREKGKIIGRPSREIRVVNTITGKEDLFKEKDMYLYNFVNEKTVLRYNKYSRNGTHYTYITNDVIVNNYYEENTDVFPFQEEYTKRKLRIGYLPINIEKRGKMKYQKTNGISRKQTEAMTLESIKQDEETLYYVYDSGELKAKLKILSDGINEIRDNYGYVKLNDKVTCYNRANKSNFAYLKQKDSIIENIEGFEENIYLKNNEILVMNVTGVTDRDLEYYISLNEKIAVFKNDTFQYFITGYDNNNFILEYPNRERINTPKSEVREAVIYGGNVLFAQLEKLE